MIFFQIENKGGILHSQVCKYEWKMVLDLSYTRKKKAKGGKTR